MILLESSELRKPTKDEKGYFNLISTDLVADIETEDRGILILTGTKIIVYLYPQYSDDDYYFKEFDTKSKAKNYAKSFLLKANKMRINSRVARYCENSKFERYY